VLTLVDVLQKTEAWFRQHGIESARLDAELVLAHSLGTDRLQLYLQHDRPLTAAELEALRGLVARRAHREPMAWILGTKGFHAIDLAVRPGVLVPRPDTETLVDAALALIAEDEEVFVADVGCGSGAVGLAVAHARPGVRVYATDLAEEALACTRDNVTRLGLEQRVAVLRGDLLAPIPAHRPIDLVLSNPPYVTTAELAGLAPEVRDHEPRLALDGGRDGLDVIRRLLPEAVRRARRAVLVEIGHQQGAIVRRICEEAGLTEVTVLPDLAGHDRVVRGVC